MGCVESKPSRKPKALQGAPSRRVHSPGQYESLLPSTGPLSAKEFRDRLVATPRPEVVRLQHAGYSLEYAFVSQRGYYPEAEHKSNQDAVCVHRCFNNDPEQLFFGVFDGHGEYGTACAQFAKDMLPRYLVAEPAFAEDPVQALQSAGALCNQQLHASSINDWMSGTTAVACLIKGRTLYVSNVGDSRAIALERLDGNLTATPLSSDQTPFRQDECSRVEAAGARVLTLEQIDGAKDEKVRTWRSEEEDSADPPRLWLPQVMSPGTAFTRSIGDHAAEEIGVIGDPEVLVYELKSSTQFVVLASDGVFEFMSNNAVASMVSRHEDVQSAALALAVESSKLWLQHEKRTDDITAIVIKFDGHQHITPRDSAPKTRDDAPTEEALHAEAAKPGNTGMAGHAAC